MTLIIIGVMLCLLVVLMFNYYDYDPYPMPTLPWMIFFGSVLSGPSLIAVGIMILIHGGVF